MKRFIPFIFLICASLHASITLTTPLVVPSTNGTALTTATVSNLACGNVVVNIAQQTATASCSFCNDTANGSQDLSCPPISGLPSFSLALNHTTGAFTVLFLGQTIYSSTLTGTALSTAWSTDTGATNTIQNATEKYLLNLNIVAGSQNDTW